ncbi:MAG: KpsF/GutQ family sugar-phosphate isomerase [Deltaproteobacteria bacterium]|nr:MAG: KpsF/GutQ family sugar-phosphate isomerase [Deltaproteobacteria bacterium]
MARAPTHPKRDACLSALCYFAAMPRAPLETAREVLAAEAAAVAGVAEHLGPAFEAAVEAVLACQGRIVVTGMGKSGFIAQKLSATLASTGSPSLYLHPAEALHGDLGRVLAGDVVVALSHSGETDEVVRMLPPLERLGVTLIALTGEAGSTLGRRAHHCLTVGPVAEACPLGLAPTASSIALLALADALAMSVLEARAFTEEEYARLHPAGSLGRKLMKVEEIMRAGEANPVVQMEEPLSRAVAVMTQTPGRPGATHVVDADGVLVGIFTDGDLRRLIEAGHHDFTLPISEFMNPNPRTVAPSDLVRSAAELMRDAKLDQLSVVDASGRPIGLLDVQDLLEARLL